MTRKKKISLDEIKITSFVTRKGNWDRILGGSNGGGECDNQGVSPPPQCGGDTNPDL